jgi:hypothetical protein
LVAKAFHDAWSASEFTTPTFVLNPGESSFSAAGLYYLVYQLDGKLVLYRTADGAPMWSSDTHGTSPGLAVLQADGNLVVYDASSLPVFNTGTATYWRSRLAIQDDGNLVIYAPDGTPVWDSLSNP